MLGLGWAKLLWLCGLKWQTVQHDKSLCIGTFSLSKKQKRMKLKGDLFKKKYLDHVIWMSPVPWAG